MDYVLRVDSGAMVARSGEPDMSEDDLRVVEELASARRQILDQIEKRVVGQREVIDHLLISLFSRGHCLFVGVPGLAKTLLISTLAEVLNLTFNRVQFTPDLMPSDITGTDILEEDRTTGRRKLRFMRGPIFANIILADEVNRTPPETQAALLQAMQEYRVTAGGETYPLDLPFLVFATQNPIEQEGTYPLPEAQLDRFMFLVDVGYPTEEDEVEIVRSTTGARQVSPEKILSPEKVLALQDLVRRVPVPDHVVRYAVSLVRHTRPKEPDTRIHPKERRLGSGTAGQSIPGDRCESAGGAERPLCRLGRGRTRARAFRSLPPGASQFPCRIRGDHRAEVD